MKRTEINTHLNLPREFDEITQGARIYDSSCSPEARVYFIDRGDGFFLKSAAVGELKREAELAGFFHSKGLTAEVVSYLSGDDGKDWLLTARVSGEDLTHKTYIDNPERLCDAFANVLRELHSLDFDGCPVKDRTADYFALAEKNFHRGIFDKSLFGEERFEDLTAQRAREIILLGKDAFKSDTLIHGDYCLPNVIFNGWNFSGFVDLGNAGVGDRHIDLFWGAWTLRYNLGTDKYRERFFDAYGRDKVDKDILEIVEITETFG